MSSEPPPQGPLLGSEFARATEPLTDKQLLAYRHFREGTHTKGWIARQMGITRQAVMQHVVKAEKKLGYEPSFTPKRKTPYKSVARREVERESAQVLYIEEQFAQLSPSGQRRVTRILESKMADEEKLRRLRTCLEQLDREHQAERGWEDEEPDAAERAAELEADFPGMRPQDFVRDWGND